jgi:MFS family permease
VALLAAVFIRNRPEELGQRRDGERADEDSQSLNSLGGSLNSLDGSLNSLDGSPDGLEAGGLATARFSVRRALLTLQFFVATSAVLANAVSWRVLTVHGRLHLENLGFTTTVAAAILGVRVGVSAVGRLSGALGDFIAPTRVFSLALVVHACGITGLAYAETMPVAYLCVATIGVGYGAGYISGPVVFADFFGRDAFVGTSSLRIALVGLVGFVGPSWAGAAADRSGSYTSTLLVLSAICLVAAVAIFACRRPALVEAPASAST